MAALALRSKFDVNRCAAVVCVAGGMLDSPGYWGEACQIRRGIGGGGGRSDSPGSWGVPPALDCLANLASKSPSQVVVTAYKNR